MIHETTPIRTPKGVRFIVLTDNQKLQALYGKPQPVLAPRAQHLVRQAPAYMGFGRPAQNAAAQP